MALDLVAADIGITPSTPNTPYGVLMETGYPDATATLVCFVTGIASLYFSTGGGVTGASRHEEVSAAATDFVKMSAQYLGAMRKTENFPVPAPGKTTFYVKTASGVLTTTARETDLGNMRSALSPLFHAGQNVITQIRLKSPQPG